MAYRACRKRQSVSGQQHAQDTGKGELSRILLHAAQIDRPHGTNETDRTEHTYRREIFHRVQTGPLQGGISHGIGQCYGGHEESHAQRIKGEQGGKRGFRTGFKPIKRSPQHENARQKMAEAQHLLPLHPTVCNNTYQRGHEQRHDALDRIKPTDVLGHTDFHQITSHRGQISPPHGVFQEVHHRQAHL